MCRLLWKGLSQSSYNQYARLHKSKQGTSKKEICDNPGQKNKRQLSSDSNTRCENWCSLPGNLNILFAFVRPKKKKTRSSHPFFSTKSLSTSETCGSLALAHPVAKSSHDLGHYLDLFGALTWDIVDTIQRA